MVHTNQIRITAVNGKNNLISKKFMTKKIPLKKIVETFPETY